MIQENKNTIRSNKNLTKEGLSKMKSEEKKQKGVRWIYWIAGFLMIILSLVVPLKSILVQGVSQW